MNTQILLEHFSDHTEIAKKFRCTRQAVGKWFSFGIPPARCIQIERFLKGRLKCEQMRPDLDWKRHRGQPYVVATVRSLPSQGAPNATA